MVTILLPVTLLLALVAETFAEVRVAKNYAALGDSYAAGDVQDLPNSFPASTSLAGASLKHIQSGLPTTLMFPSPNMVSKISHVEELPV